VLELNITFPMVSMRTSLLELILVDLVKVDLLALERADAALVGKLCLQELAPFYSSL